MKLEHLRFRCPALQVWNNIYCDLQQRWIRGIKKRNVSFVVAGTVFNADTGNCDFASNVKGCPYDATKVDFLNNKNNIIYRTRFRFRWMIEHARVRTTSLYTTRAWKVIFLHFTAAPQSITITTTSTMHLMIHAVNLMYIAPHRRSKSDCASAIVCSLLSVLQCPSAGLWPVTPFECSENFFNCAGTGVEPSIQPCASGECIASTEAICLTWITRIREP